MADVHRRFPDDAEVATIYADAVMNLRPWELWTPDGKPQADTLELVAVLEGVLRRHPNHPGANHYYIHSVEASPTPERALASAARLETLVPGAGHLVHMPTHIYMHTGDLDRIASLNAKAAEADERYFGIANPEGVYPFMYYAHNLHFVMVGHLLTGRYEDSLAEAKKMGRSGRPACQRDGADGRVGDVAADLVAPAFSQVGRHPLHAAAAGVADVDEDVRCVCAGAGTADDGEED
jgi:hypothetical protein